MTVIPTVTTVVMERVVICLHVGAETITEMRYQSYYRLHTQECRERFDPAFSRHSSEETKNVVFR